MQSQNSYFTQSIEWEYQQQNNDIFNAQYQQFLQSFRIVLRNIMKQSTDSTRASYLSTPSYSLQFIQTVLDILPFDGRPCTFTTFNVQNRCRFFQNGVQILQQHFIFIRRIQQMLYPNRMQIFDVAQQLGVLLKKYKIVNQNQFDKFFEIFHNQFQMAQTDPQLKIQHILMPQDSQVIQSYQDLQNIFLSLIQQCRFIARTSSNNLTHIKAVAIMITKKQQRLQVINKQLQPIKRNILLRSQVLSHTKIKKNFQKQITIYNDYQNAYARRIYDKQLGNDTLKIHWYANSKYNMYVSILNYMQILCSRIIRMIKVIIKSYSSGIQLKPIQQGDKTSQLSYFARLNFQVTRKIRLWGIFGRFAYMQLTQTACKILFQQYDTFLSVIKNTKGKIQQSWKNFVKKIGQKVSHNSVFNFISTNYSNIKNQFTNLKNIVLNHQNSITQSRNNLKVINSKVQNYLSSQTSIQKNTRKQNLQIMSQLQNMKRVLKLINQQGVGSLKVSKSQFSAAINIINNELNIMSANNTYLFSTQKALGLKKSINPLVQISKDNPESKIDLVNIKIAISQAFSLQSESMSSKIIQAYQNNMSIIQRKINQSIQYLKRIQGNTISLLAGQDNNSSKLDQIINYVQGYINDVSNNYKNYFGNSSDTLAKQVFNQCNQCLNQLIMQNTPKTIAFQMSEASQNQISAQIQRLIQQKFAQTFIRSNYNDVNEVSNGMGQQNIQYLMSNANYSLASTMQMNLKQAIMYLNMNQSQVSQYIFNNQRQIYQSLNTLGNIVISNDQQMANQIAHTRAQIRSLGAIFSSSYNTLGLNQNQKEQIGVLLKKVNEYQPVIKQIYVMISMVQQNLDQMNINNHSIMQQNYVIWSTLNNLTSQISGLSNNLSYSFQQFNRQQDALLREIRGLSQQNFYNHQQTRNVIKDSQLNIKKSVQDQFLKLTKQTMKQKQQMQENIKGLIQKYSKQSRQRQDQQKQLLKTNTKLVQSIGIIKNNFQKVVQQINENFSTNFNQKDITQVLIFIKNNKKDMNELQQRNSQFQLNIKGILSSIGSTSKFNVYRDAILNHIDQLKQNNNKTQKHVMVQKHSVDLKKMQLINLTQQNEKDQKTIKSLARKVNQYQNQLQELKSKKSQLQSSLKLTKQSQSTIQSIMNQNSKGVKNSNNKINQLMEKIEDLNMKSIDYRSKVSLLQASLSNSQRNYHKMEQQNQKLQQSLQKVKAQKTKAEKQFNQIQLQLTKLKSQLKNTVDNLNKYKENQKQLKNQLQKLMQKDNSSHLNELLSVAKAKQIEINKQLKRTLALLEDKQRERMQIKQKYSKQQDKTRKLQIKQSKIQSQNQLLKDGSATLQKEINKMKSVNQQFERKNILYQKREVQMQTLKNKYNQTSLKADKYDKLKQEIQAKNTKIALLQKGLDKQKQGLSNLTNVQIQYQNYKSKSQQQKGRFNLNIQSLNSQITMTKRQLDIKQSQINKLYLQVQQKQKELVQVKSNMKNIEAESNKANITNIQYKSQIDRQTLKNAELQRRLIQLGNESNKINKLQYQIQSLKNDIQNKSQRLINSDKYNISLNDQLRQKQSQLNKMKIQYNQMKLQIQKFKFKIESQQKTVNKLEKQSGKFDEMQRSYNKTKQELAISKNKIQIIQKQLEENKSQVLRMKGWQQYKQKYQILQHDVQKNHKQLKQLKSKFLDKQSQLLALIQTKSLFQKQKIKLEFMYKSKQTQLQNLNVQYGVSKKDNVLYVQQVKNLNIGMNSLKTEIQVYKNKESSYILKIDQIKMQVQGYQSQLNQYSDKYQKIVLENQNLVKSHNEQLNFIKQQNVLQQKKMDQLRYKIQSGYSRLLNQIIYSKQMKKIIDNQSQIRQQIMTLNKANQQRYNQAVQKWNIMVKFNRDIIQIFPNIRNRNNQRTIQDMILQNINEILESKFKNQKTISQLNQSIFQKQNAYKKQIKNIQMKQKDLTTRINQLTQKQNNLQVYLQQKKTQLASMKTINNQMKLQIVRLTDKITDLQSVIRRNNVIIQDRRIYIDQLQKQNIQLTSKLSQKRNLQKVIKDMQFQVTDLRRELSQRKSNKELVDSFGKKKQFQQKSQQLQFIKVKLAEYKTLQRRIQRSQDFIQRYQRVIGLVIQELTFYNNSYQFLNNKIKQNIELTSQQTQLFSSYNILIEKGNQTLTTMLRNASQNGIQLKAQPQQQSTLNSINQNSKINNSINQRSRLNNTIIQKGPLLQNILEDLNISRIQTKQIESIKMEQQQQSQKIKFFKKNNQKGYILVPSSQPIVIPKQHKDNVQNIDTGVVIKFQHSQSLVQSLQSALLFLTNVLFKLLQNIERIMISVKHQIDVWDDIVKKLNNKQNPSPQGIKYSAIASLILNIFSDFQQILTSCFTSIGQQDKYNAFIQMSTVMFGKQSTLKQNKNKLIQLIQKYKGYN